MVFKSISRSFKNLGYSDVAVLVREATANNKSKPSEDVMRELAQLTYSKAEFTDLMPILDRRLNDRTRQWRHVYKSLCLVHYLLLAGSPAAIEYFRINAYLIKTLREFQYLDSSAVDQGALVRSKAREVSLLLSDNDSLNRARADFNGSRPMRSASVTSLSSANSDDHTANQEAEREAERAAAARREREAEAKRQFALQEDAARARAERDQIERQRLQAELARAEADERARVDAVQQAEKQAQEAIQAQQLEMARWQLEQSKMNMYGTWPQYTGMYSQPTSFMPMMSMPTGMVQPPQTIQPPMNGMVGSNNPFAPINVATAPAEQPLPSRTPSLDMSHEERSHSSFSNQPSTPSTEITNPYNAPSRQQKPASEYMDRLDNLLASGDGVDTFGNAGNQRLGHLGNRAHLFAYSHS